MERDDRPVAVGTDPHDAARYVFAYDEVPVGRIDHAVSNEVRPRLDGRTAVAAPPPARVVLDVAEQQETPFPVPDGSLREHEPFGQLAELGLPVNELCK